MHGRVIYLNLARGYGIVQSDGDAGLDVFFHASAVIGEPIEAFAVGDHIAFEPAVTARGPAAYAVRHATCEGVVGYLRLGGPGQTGFGYGFIHPAEGGEDLYFHHTATRPAGWPPGQRFSRLRVGQRVCFQEARGRPGQRQRAVDVRPLSDDDNDTAAASRDALRTHRSAHVSLEGISPHLGPAPLSCSLSVLQPYEEVRMDQDKTPSVAVVAAWARRGRELNDVATERARLVAAAVTVEARFADLLERSRAALGPLCARLHAEAVACQTATVGEGQVDDGEYSDLLTLARGCTEWVAAYDQAATDTLAAGMRYVSTVAALLAITDAEVEARAQARIAERAAQLTLAASTVPVV